MSFGIIATEQDSIFELAAGSHPDKRKSAMPRVVRDERECTIILLLYCMLDLLAPIESVTEDPTVRVVLRH